MFTHTPSSQETNGKNRACERTSTIPYRTHQQYASEYNPRCLPNLVLVHGELGHLNGRSARHSHPGFGQRLGRHCSSRIPACRHRSALASMQPFVFLHSALTFTVRPCPCPCPYPDVPLLRRLSPHCHCLCRCAPHHRHPLSLSLTESEKRELLSATHRERETLRFPPGRSPKV